MDKILCRNIKSCSIYNDENLGQIFKYTLIGNGKKYEGTFMSGKLYGHLILSKKNNL